MGTGYKYVLFDLDDTLIASDVLRRTALQSCGHPNPPKIPLFELRSKSPPALLRGHSSASMAKYWDAYLETAKSLARPAHNDLLSVTQKIRRNGARLAVVTSSPGKIARAVLGHAGYEDLFDECIVGYGDCRRRKPFPDPINKALAILNGNPADSLYIGDSENDAKAAHNASLKFVFAAWGSNAKIPMKIVADFTISVPRNLLKLVITKS